MLKVSDGFWGQGQAEQSNLSTCVMAAITHWPGEPTLRGHSKDVASMS